MKKQELQNDGQLLLLANVVKLKSARKEIIGGTTCLGSLALFRHVVKFKTYGASRQERSNISQNALLCPLRPRILGGIMLHCCTRMR